MPAVVEGSLLGRDARGFAFGLLGELSASAVFGSAVGGWHVPPELGLLVQLGDVALPAGGVGGGVVGPGGEALVCAPVGLVGAGGRVRAVQLGVQAARFGGDLAAVGNPAASFLPGGELAGAPGGAHSGRVVGCGSMDGGPVGGLVAAFGGERADLGSAGAFEPQREPAPGALGGELLVVGLPLTKRSPDAICGAG